MPQNAPSISKFFFMRYNYLPSKYFLLILILSKSIDVKRPQHFSTRSMLGIKGYTPNQRLTQKVKPKEKKNSIRISKGGFPSRILQKRRVFCAPFIHRSLAIFWCPFWTPSCLLNVRPSTNIIICRSFVRLRWTYRTH